MNMDWAQLSHTDTWRRRTILALTTKHAEKEDARVNYRSLLAVQLCVTSRGEGEEHNCAIESPHANSNSGFKLELIMKPPSVPARAARCEAGTLIKTPNRHQRYKSDIRWCKPTFQ
jgi:hypothetical protein